MSYHTATPYKFHLRSAAQEHDGSIYSEPFEGHAYAVAMQPRYVENEKWKIDAAFITHACNSYAELVDALTDLVLAHEGILTVNKGRLDSRDDAAKRAETLLLRLRNAAKAEGRS